MTTTSEEVTIGIKDARLRAGMTQVDLAAACGVTQGIVSAWELGHKVPRARMLARVARALNVSVDSLITWHDSPQ
jgi:transcriptional regulator with XRE-family HTH domain